jgi:hypothetical protein
MNIHTFSANQQIAAKSMASRRFWSLVWLPATILLFYLQHQPDFALAREVATVNPYRVEAAFLRNFAHYVSWPDYAFSDDESPWKICVLGPDPFRDFLEETFEGRTEQGRSFAIFRAHRVSELPRCQIVFIAYHNEDQRRTALRALKDKPVLTVGKAPDFLVEGGIIQFRVRDRVSIGVNLDQARDVSLGIQTKMLEVSEQILENGVIRTMR